MIIPIPRKIGQLTGWKAVAALIVILGIAGLGIWFNMQPRALGKGTWDIEPERAMFYQITATQRGKLKAEFVPEGGGKYEILVVDEANKNKLVSPAPGDTDVVKISQQEGAGPLTIPALTLNAGTYYVIANNPGTTKVTIKYAIFELPE
jgi:hypothetical protein